MKPALALAALSLAACATASPPGPGMAEARFGDTVQVGRTTVRPVALVEDSRCPRPVACVWAGRVRIDAMVGKARRQLVAGEPVRVAGSSLLLAEVLPQKQAGVAIAPADYRFRFRFT